MCCLSFSGNTTACLISSSSTTTAADAEEKEKKEAFKNRVNEHINKVDTKGDDKDDLGLKAAEEEAEGSAKQNNNRTTKKRIRNIHMVKVGLQSGAPQGKGPQSGQNCLQLLKFFAIVEIVSNC